MERLCMWRWHKRHMTTWRWHVVFTPRLICLLCLTVCGDQRRERLQTSVWLTVFYQRRRQLRVVFNPALPVPSMPRLLPWSSDCVDQSRIRLTSMKLALLCIVVVWNKTQRDRRHKENIQICCCQHSSDASLHHQPLWPGCWWVTELQAVCS